MKKALMAVALVAMLAGGAWAQTGGVIGLVVDVDGNPVEEARVSLWQDGECVAHVLTDALGAFTFADVPAGIYALNAGKKKVGNASIEQVEVFEGQITDVGTLTLVGKQQCGPGKEREYQQD